MELSAEVAERAMVLLQAYPLRAYDSVQLASAQILVNRAAAVGLPPVTFVCADDRLCEVAASEGLHLDDPRLHP